MQKFEDYIVQEYTVCKSSVFHMKHFITFNGIMKAMPERPMTNIRILIYYHIRVDTIIHFLSLKINVYCNYPFQDFFH